MLGQKFDKKTTVNFQHTAKEDSSNIYSSDDSMYAVEKPKMRYQKIRISSHYHSEVDELNRKQTSTENHPSKQTSKIFKGETADSSLLESTGVKVESTGVMWNQLESSGVNWSRVDSDEISWSQSGFK